MHLLLILSTFLLWGNSYASDFSVEELIAVQPEWERYKADFNKLYDPEEELLRLQIYLENSKMIEEHNKLYRRGVYTYELGHNQFSDLSYQEYLDMYPQEHMEVENTYHEKPLNYEEDRENNSSGQDDNKDTIDLDNSEDGTDNFDEDSIDLVDSNEDLASLDEDMVESDEDNGDSKIHKAPVSMDWRKLGGVTRVKSEGSCGAHWAFSAVGALEGQLFRKFHHLAVLSEQNLIDCAGRKYHNKGCTNGTAYNAFLYIIKNKGIDTNKTYPYTGHSKWFTKCKYKKLPTNPQVHSVIILKRGNETQLATTVAQLGPVSVAIDARGNKFRFYTRGVYHNPHCSSSILTRQMVVVGYAPNYFIIKNSWGTKWGLSGYMLLGRNGRNQCGVASKAVVPIV